MSLIGFRNFHLFSHFPTSTKFWTLSQIVFMFWITPQLLFNWRSPFIFREINPLWINNYTMLIKNYFFNSHTFTLGCILLILLITLAFYTYFIFNYHRFVLYNWRPQKFLLKYVFSLTERCSRFPKKIISCRIVNFMMFVRQECTR